MIQASETIEALNKRLVDFFGLDTESSNPIWRIVWSTEQTEILYTNFTPEGLELLHPRAMTVLKYPFNKNRWILERLVLVPSMHTEMVVKKSYEPMWVFDEDKPPKWEPIKHMVDIVYLALGKEPSKQPKYKDPDTMSGMTKEQFLEKEAVRVKQIQDDLFGNETDTGDALAHKSGISNPAGEWKINPKRIH